MGLRVMNEFHQDHPTCLSELRFSSDSQTCIYISRPYCPSSVLCGDKVPKAHLLPRNWQVGGETEVQATIALAAGGEAPVVRHCGDGAGGDTGQGMS